VEFAGMGDLSLCCADSRDHHLRFRDRAGRVRLRGARIPHNVLRRRSPALNMS
jgi:hypothetical protein